MREVHINITLYRIPKLTRFNRVFIPILIVIWVFSGWPQLWHNAPFPSKIHIAEATIETFSTATSANWTAPTGVTSVFVECWGAGGAGGGDTSNDSSQGGGGGGGGAYASKTITVTAGNMYSYVVGTGGSGAKGNGGDGTDSTFTGDASVQCVADAGLGGIEDGGAGGAGGTTANSDGTVEFAGGTGNEPTTGTYGGGGGGSGGSDSAGNGSGTSQTGNTAVTDGGPGGNGGDDASDGLAPASGPGGGGGGSGDRFGSSESGGDGNDGQIRLTYIALTVSEPDGTGDTVTVGDSYNITYTLTDADTTSTVDFYYDADGSGFDGTAITGCQDQAEGSSVTCSWDTTGMTPGSYYVYGISTNGSETQNDYSPGQITINAAAGLTFSVSTDVFPNITPGFAVFATTTLNVNTANAAGWNVTLSGDDQGPSNSVIDLTSDASVNITDQLEWIPGGGASPATTTAGNAVRISSLDNFGDVLAFRVMTASGSAPFRASTWWGSVDDYTDNANTLWAGIASSTVSRQIGNTNVDSGGVDALNTVLYYIDVPTTQQTGDYSGGLTYTATAN